MAEETTLRSMFTDYALETLFPDWTQHPEHARSICMARLGCNTAHAQISGADTDVKDGITDSHGQPVNIRDVTVVTGADPDPTLVKVTVIVETQGEDDPLRGNTVREIGLFVNNGTEPPDWRLVWLSDMPDMYIPRADESGGITVTSRITVPIKFSNADQINLNTQNEGLAAKIGEVENTVNIMKGSDNPAKEKANKEDLTSLSNTVGILQGSGAAAEKADKAVAAQLINKLNSATNPPSPNFPTLDSVKTKADADIVGSRPTGITSDLWAYVKTLNNGSGTATGAKEKADADIVGSRPSGLSGTLWENISSLNSNKANQDRTAESFAFSHEQAGPQSSTQLAVPWAYFNSAMGELVRNEGLEQIDVQYGYYPVLNSLPEGVNLLNYSYFSIIFNIGIGDFIQGTYPPRGYKRTLAQIKIAMAELRAPTDIEDSSHHYHYYSNVLGSCTTVLRDVTACSIVLTRKSTNSPFFLFTLTGLSGVSSENPLLISGLFTGFKKET